MKNNNALHLCGCSFSPFKGVISGYSVLQPEMRGLREVRPYLCEFTSREPMVAVNPGSHSSRAHLALHMLG